MCKPLYFRSYTTDPVKHSSVRVFNIPYVHLVKKRKNAHWRIKCALFLANLIDLAIQVSVENIPELQSYVITNQIRHSMLLRTVFLMGTMDISGHFTITYEYCECMQTQQMPSRLVQKRQFTAILVHLLPNGLTATLEVFAVSQPV
jgi:myo-inositol-1-phosphate synthase